VSASFDAGALLGTSYVLDGGLRVGLRVARSSDAVLIRELLGRQGLDREELQTARLVHFDPRRRCVLCATALIGSSETLVGVGAIELEPDRAPAPDALIVDEQHHPDLAELLTSVLLARASATARSRAA
jgi:hypothetical protein